MTRTAPEAPPMSERLIRLWPFVLAVGVAASMPADGSSAGMLVLADILLLLPLLYLLVAKMGRRGASWPVLLLLAAFYALLRALDPTAPSAVFTGVALAVLVWSVFDGELRGSPAFRVQALGMLAFGALALAGLAAEPDSARYLIAAGWLLHGIWDFAHLGRDAVVSRSYAKWCGTVDVLVAVQLVLLP